MRSALILSGGDVDGAIVENTILIEPDEPTEDEPVTSLAEKVERLFGKGAVAVELGAGEPCAPGWVRIGKGWQDPARTPEVVRAEAIAQANLGAAKRISAGFESPPGSGKRLSLSMNAQIRIVELMVDPVGAGYPISWSTIDDDDVITLKGPEDARALYRSARDAIRAVVDASTAEKAAARLVLAKKPGR